MPVYFADRCVHCGQVINNMRRAGEVIGTPFVKCPHCAKEMFLHFVMEWDEYSTAKKALVLVVFTVYSIVWAAIAFIATGVLINFAGLNRSLIELIFAVPVCVLVYRYAALAFRISQSKKRTANPRYLALVLKARQ
jgi:hypothetical protein